ncbi:MAG: cell wall-binding repeat-containing protein, partial [Kineosporiaceae bacterium]
MIVRHRSPRGRAALVVLALAVAGLSVAPSPSSAAPPPFPGFERLAGPNRYATSAALAAAAFPDGAPAAVVASGVTFPDALAGGYLAGRVGGPLLLTAPTTLPNDIAAELMALGPQTVYVLGGPTSVSEAVLTQIRELTVAGGTHPSVVRLSGPDRYATAAAVGGRYDDGIGTIGGKRTALLATGTRFPDALAAAPVAAKKALPLLLTPPAALPTVTASTLTRLQIEQVVILGGPSSVSPAVEAFVRALGIDVTRIAGVSRTETATLVADWAIDAAGFGTQRIALARADEAGGGADALSLAPLAAVSDEPVLLLARPSAADETLLSWVRGRAGQLTGGHVAGGVPSASPAALSALAVAAGGSGGGSLELTVASLPDGLAGDVTVTGPGFTRHATASTLALGLTDGTYSVTANPVGDAAVMRYLPTLRTPSPRVSAGELVKVSADYWTRLPPTTQPVDAADIQLVTGPSDGERTVVLDAAGAPDVGEVIVAGAGEETPEGLLVKVTDKDVDGDRAVLTTQPARLEEALPQGEFTISTTVASTDVGEDFAQQELAARAADAALGGAPLEASRRAARAAQRKADAKPRVRIGRRGVSETPVGRDFPCEGSVRLALDASVGVEASVNLTVKWEGGLFHPHAVVTFTAQLQESASAEASVTGSASCSVPETSLLPRPLKLQPISFTVGLFPIVIVPEVQLYAKAQASATASVRTAVEQQLTATAGLTVDGGSISPIHRLTNTYAFTPPTLSASGSISASVGPRVSLKLYGAGGPYAQVDPGLELSADIHRQPWWSLDAVVTGKVGVDVPMLDIDKSKDPLFTWRRTLASATTAAPVPPPTVRTAAAPSGEVGTPYSTTLAASGGTAPYTWTAVGALPAGLSLSGSGVLSGTPTTAALTEVEVQVRDSAGRTGFGFVTIRINPASSGPTVTRVDVLSDLTCTAEVAAFDDHPAL